LLLGIPGAIFSTGNHLFFVLKLLHISLESRISSRYRNYEQAPAPDTWPTFLTDRLKVRPLALLGADEYIPAWTGQRLPILAPPRFLPPLIIDRDLR